MKIKLRTIVDSGESASKLGELKLKAKFAYEYSKSIELISKELKAFQDVRNKKLKEFGVESKEKKGLYSFKDDNQSKFEKEIEELLDKSVEIKVEKFSIEELNDVDVEPNILRPLSWLIKD
tara:strand:- start:757 stop:1119 length:363 start_codon:yes stop_codon:yes gene_type:complete